MVPGRLSRVPAAILENKRLKEAVIVRRTIRGLDWRPWKPLPLFRFFSPPLVSPQVAILGFLPSSAFFEVPSLMYLR